MEGLERGYGRVRRGSRIGRAEAKVDGTKI
jgi:hypothetical protein